MVVVGSSKLLLSHCKYLTTISNKYTHRYLSKSMLANIRRMFCSYFHSKDNSHICHSITLFATPNTIKSKDWEYANHVTTLTHSGTLKALDRSISLIGVIINLQFYYEDWVSFNSQEFVIYLTLFNLTRTYW